jgi:peptidoglycan-N-acetylglucosamine deacetylase
VALTFDNGPTEVTGRVLDILRDRQLRAGFFVVGSRLDAPGGRALAQRAHAEGHWIGNHTMHHATPLGEHRNPRYGIDEIEDAQALLDAAELTSDDRFFRPFGRQGRIGPHLLSEPARDHLVQGRYTMVLWNNVPRDWEGDASWVDRALADTETVDSHDGTSVVVLHDLPTGGMNHLDTFLDRLDQGGHQVTTTLPRSCVPIRRGLIDGDIERYVATGRDAAAP